MSTLASIDIKLSRKKAFPISSESIIKALILSGWNAVNNGKILYLPLGDEDDFDWQEKALNQSDIFSIIEQKERNNEIVGVGITWKDTAIGGTLLINPAFDISFSLTINRKRLFDNVTDVNWYLERLLPCLETDLMTVEHFSFSQD